jgi:glycogen debranching enzyme
MSPQIKEKLLAMGLSSIQELEVERGILASGRNEAYGCIFGRDSLIVALNLIAAYEKTRNDYFLALVKKILWNLGDLQGTAVNIESGEEPGKIIHEFRPSAHEHLTTQKEGGEPAWYVYPDHVMRNFDTVDATPLFLMAAHAYLLASNDTEFIEQLLPNIHAALSWVLEYGDSNGDGLIDYSFHEARVYGGLKTQSWMDSTESVFFETSNEKPEYPLAPVEAQAYTYAALCAWGDYFGQNDTVLAETLHTRAKNLKTVFNEMFVLPGRTYTSLAFAVDGKGRPLVSARSSIGHCLFAVYKNVEGEVHSIIDATHIPRVVERLLQPDLYVRGAGLRTLSSRSKHYEPGSYHNGSIWPHDTVMAAQGLDNFGYSGEAAMIRSSITRAYLHFETPIELFQYANRKFAHYQGPSGQGACRTQAWSAASLLSML